MTSIKKIEPWRAIYKSWYSKEVYREAAHRWRGLGYQYLVMLLLGLWLLASIHVHLIVHSFVCDYLKPMMQAMPKMEFNHGVLTVDRKEQIIEVKDPRSGKVVIRFDLTENPLLAPIDQDGIYLESRRVIFHFKGKEDVYDYAKMKDGKWEWQYQLRVLDAIANWTGVVVLGLFWMSSFILCALQTLVYALAGKVFAAIAKRRLTYAQLVRISVVALTPPLIIDTCQKLFGFGIPAWTLVSVLLTAGFIVFGVKVNSVSFEWSLTQGVSTKPAEKNSAA